jgi:hypothetical protein
MVEDACTVTANHGVGVSMDRNHDYAAILPLCKRSKDVHVLPKPPRKGVFNVSSLS